MDKWHQQMAISSFGFSFFSDHCAALFCSAQFPCCCLHLLMDSTHTIWNVYTYPMPWWNVWLELVPAPAFSMYNDNNPTPLHSPRQLRTALYSQLRPISPMWKWQPMPNQSVVVCSEVCLQEIGKNERATNREEKKHCKNAYITSESKECECIVIRIPFSSLRTALYLHTRRMGCAYTLVRQITFQKYLCF